MYSLVRLAVVVLISMTLPAMVSGQPTIAVFQNSDSPGGYTGADDNSIYEDLPDNSNGGQGLIFVGATGSSVRRGLLRFDLSTIPPNATVLDATLELELEQLSGPGAVRLADGGDTHTLHRLTRRWGEGTADARDPDSGSPNNGGLGAPARESDATWAAAEHMLTPWSTPGGDFVSAPSRSLPVGIHQLNPTENLYTFQSTALNADVQVMVSDSTLNHGWILIGDEAGDRNARRFYASETLDGLRPRLTVTYEIRNAIPVANWALYQ